MRSVANQMLMVLMLKLMMPGCSFHVCFSHEISCFITVSGFSAPAPASSCSPSPFPAAVVCRFCGCFYFDLPLFFMMPLGAIRQKSKSHLKAKTFATKRQSWLCVSVPVYVCVCARDWASVVCTVGGKSFRLPHL